MCERIDAVVVFGVTEVKELLVERFVPIILTNLAVREGRAGKLNQG